MNILLQGLFSLIPHLIVAVFLVGLNGQHKAMPLSYIAVVIIAYFVWKLLLFRLSAVPLTV
jgi:L-lactate permease